MRFTYTNTSHKGEQMYPWTTHYIFLFATIFSHDLVSIYMETEWCDPFPLYDFIELFYMYFSFSFYTL